MLEIFGIYIRTPIALLLAIPVLLAIPFLVSRLKVLNSFVKKFPAISRYLSGFSAPREILKAGLLLIGLLLAVIAASRPQWGLKEEVGVVNGRNIVVALDVSRSMLATDAIGGSSSGVSRLELAKIKTKELVERLVGEGRVALVLFAGEAHTICPMTSDVPAFANYIDQIDASTVVAQPTDISAPLREAMRIFRTSAEGENAPRVLIILTDGENFSASAERYFAAAAKLGIRVVGICFGSEMGAPVPIVDVSGEVVGYEKDRDGKLVVTKSDFDTFSKFVKRAGGVALRADPSGGDVENVIEMVKRMERGEVEERVAAMYAEQYKKFLLPSAAAVVLSMAL